MQPDLWTEKKNPELPPSTGTNKSLGLLMGMGLGSLLTLGAVQYLTAKTPAGSPSIPVTAPSPTPKSQAVTTAQVKIIPVERTLTATGTVSAVEMIPVLAQATGLQIQQTLVKEGDFVEKGQIVARLDDRILQAQYAEAIANLEQAQARLEELEAGNRREEIVQAQETVNRIQAEISQVESDWELARKRAKRNQTLQAEGAIAQDRLDEVLNEARSKQALVEQTQARLREAQAQLAQLQAGPRPEIKAQARAQLAQAQSRRQLVAAQLQNTTLVAPVSGKVVTRNAKIGDVSNSQTPLFEIIEQGRLELQLNIPANQLKSLRPGQKVKISATSESALQLQGEIREIYPLVDANSRQGLAKVSLPSHPALKAGMFLQAAIITSTVSSPTIPMAAVLPQADGRTLVYVLQADQTVRELPIQIGSILPNQQVEVRSGLQSGEIVIVKGATYLKDGDSVLLKESEMS